MNGLIYSTRPECVLPFTGYLNSVKELETSHSVSVSESNSYGVWIPVFRQLVRLTIDSQTAPTGQATRPVGQLASETTRRSAKTSRRVNGVRFRGCNQ